MVVNDPIIEEKSKTGVLNIPLDPIHGGLRMAVFGSFFGAAVVGFGASLMLIPNPGVIPFIIGAVAAAGTSTGVERALKDRWVSGREFVADSDRIAVAKDGKIEAVVNPQQQVNVLLWRFEIKKDGPRAKKGWHLLAMALKQDDNYVVIYSAVEPDAFEDMPLSQAFVKLKRNKKDKKVSLSTSSNMKQAGEQKRLHDAEIARQIIGGDMRIEHFAETIEFLQTHFPKWMMTY